MKLRWHAYWIALFSLLLGILYWKNAKYYKEKSYLFKSVKTVIEAVIISLSAVYVPSLLIVYGCMWITSKVDRPAFKAGLGLICGVVLSLLGSFFLEMLVIIGGVFGMELLSRDFLESWRERRRKRLTLEQAA